MHRFAIVIVALASSTALAAGVEATAELHTADGKSVGTATLTQTKSGVRVKAKLENLPPGIHAFHLHAVGKCDAPDFKSAGGHFNPDHKEHGLKNEKGHHAGDLRNIRVKDDGTATVKTLAKGVTLEPGDHSLLGPDGSAIVIHAKADDNKTDPAGNAGDRIACGVVTKK